MKILDIEQGSPEWHAARLGCITGTKFGDAIGSPKVQHTLMCELIAEQMTEQTKEIKMNDAMERGQIEEGFARKEYEKRTGITVEKVGFVVADHIDTRIGFSPDGVVRVDGEIVGGVEIKNPASSTFISYLIDGGVPKDYFEQVMMPFVCIPTVQWWDFIAYDSRIKIQSKRMMIVRVTREEIAEEIAAARVKLRGFIEKWDNIYSEIVF